MSDPHDVWVFRWPNDLEKRRREADLARARARAMAATLVGLSAALVVIGLFWWARP